MGDVGEGTCSRGDSMCAKGRAWRCGEASGMRGETQEVWQGRIKRRLVCCRELSGYDFVGEKKIEEGSDVIEFAFLKDHFASGRGMVLEGVWG